jgi:hypothetical protein
LSPCANSQQPTATTTNEWREAFDASYNTVLSDFSIPSGKNRYHKFRDKIVEIWKAMQSVSDNNPLYAMAERQYKNFLRVTDERKAAVGLDDRKPAPSASPVSHKMDTSKAKSKAVPAPTSTATPVTGTKKRPAVGVPPTTSPSTATTLLSTVGFATTARTIAKCGNSTDQSEWPEALMSKLETITIRKCHPNYPYCSAIFIGSACE